MTDLFSCIIVDDEPMAIELLMEQLSHLYKNIRITATCTGWEDALYQIRENSVDLLFLDISMPGKNGIDILKLLPPIDSEIIFITAHEQYALEAFNFSASGYLLKPVSDIDLSRVIDRALIRVRNKRSAHDNSNTNENKIGIPNRNGIDYINTSDIIYLESVNKCTRIVTIAKEYMSFSPLTKFMTLTSNYAFLQVHRSYIVNVNNISRYEASGLIIMSNKQQIPITRTFKNDLLSRLNNHF